MKISSIDLLWFRGAAESIGFATDLKNVVVYGQNGSGKSTFVDAMEYIITGGRIRHLAHEYSGPSQLEGVRNTHAPEGTPSLVRVAYEGEGEIELRAGAGGGPQIESVPPSLAQEIQAQDPSYSILRQDEVAWFIHATKGKKYSALLPLLGLEKLEQCADNLHKLSRKYQSSARVESIEQRLSDLRTLVGEALEEPLADSVKQKLDVLRVEYTSLPDSTTLPEVLQGLGEAISARINSADEQQRLFQQISELSGCIKPELIEALTSARSALGQQLDALLDRKIATLEPAQQFLEKIPADCEVIPCPACGREIKRQKLEQHVAQELNSLREVTRLRDHFDQSFELVSEMLRDVHTAACRSEIASWLGEPRQRALHEALDKVSTMDLPESVSEWDQELEASLYDSVSRVAAQVSKALENAPPSVTKLFDDKKCFDACLHFQQVSELESQLPGLSGIQEALSSAEHSVRRLIRSKTEQLVSRLSGDIQDLWGRLHPDEPIKEISLYQNEGTEKAIDISLQFFGVDQPSPRLTLSEGHRNSLGLCIFLALVLASETGPYPLLLDDVVSSLDRHHRGLLASILDNDLGDRQVLLFTHDREWFSELRTRLSHRCWKFMVLKPWQDPNTGIAWSHSQYTLDDARLLRDEHPEAAGNRVRAIMDSELAIAAERLKIPMPFLRGDKNDHRTCVDFLRGIISQAKGGALRKRTQDQAVPYELPLDHWHEVRSLLISWADRASHAGSLTPIEVDQLIDSCEKALGYLSCPDCNDPIWIADVQVRKRLQCSCGHIQWRYG